MFSGLVTFRHNDTNKNVPTRVLNIAVGSGGAAVGAAAPPAGKHAHDVLHALHKKKSITQLIHTQLSVFAYIQPSAELKYGYCF